MVTRRSVIHGFAAAGGAAGLAACGAAAGGGDAPAPSKGPVKLVLLHAWDEATPIGPGVSTPSAPLVIGFDARA